jgi:acetylornithine deacetylase/succinyl-diaminopimelate desuccinylase-like protein
MPAESRSAASDLPSRAITCTRRSGSIMDPVEILRQVVAIPSVNPMGLPLGGDRLGEAALTDYLEGLFRGLGIPALRQPVEPDRQNILARVDGHFPPQRGGRLLLFAVHQDTVPATGMTIPPWTPSIRGSRLYGRGACDVKGGMAAMLTAVARLKEERPAAMPTILLGCTVNEEYGFSGAEALARLWNAGGSAILPRRPDAAVVAEPTSLQVVVAHKGVVRWRCHARGRAAHGAHPEAGENAVYRMARAVVAIERYQHEVVGTLGSHPLCGRATLNVGTIAGGVSVNTVPDRCTIEIDRRLAGREDPEGARRHLIEFLQRHCDAAAWLEHDPPFMRGLPLDDDANGAVAEQLAAVVRDAAGECSQVGVPYATDAASFSAAGVPAVVFGPGSIEQAHTADEWIDLDEVRQAAEIYYRFAATFR